MNEVKIFKIEIYLSLFIVVLLFSVLFIQKAQINNAVRIYKDAEVCEYDEDLLLGVNIPQDARVYFIKNVTELFSGNVRKLFYPNDKIVGTYLEDDKSILIMEEDPFFMRSGLTHEVAHYLYNNLSSDEKKEVSTYKRLFCRSDREFYAYNLQSFGWAVQ